MEENEVYYVILNMNCQYEICRKCPKIGIFKGTHEECEAFIDGIRCSNEPNAEFCYISSVLDTINGRLWYEVKTNDIALYSSLNKDAKARNECEAFIKGIKYELENDKTKTHEAMYTESEVLDVMKLLKASCEGKTLQTPNGKGGWIDCNTENIIFYDLLRFEYRIKEEDKVSKAQTCIYDTDSCRHAKYEFGEPDTSKCKDCNRNPNMKENKMEENSNNLRYENDEPPVSSLSVDATGYTWAPYYSQDEELKNNLKSVVASDMGIDEKVNIIIALCRQMMVQIPTENSPYVLTVQNPYNQPKVWYNYRGDQINPNDVLCNSKPNPYMPYEYCSTQLKSDTENNDLVHVPVGGTIPTELYNIIKDKLKHGAEEYHECDGERIDKKEYETLYNAIGHNYDDFGDNVEISDFKLPNMNGWYIRIK